MYTQSFITINDIAIRVLDTGSAADALVFVHGNSCSAEFWEEQLGDEELATRYRLISFDLPGHGGSGRPAVYRMREMALLIPALIGSLGLKRYAMVGISFGTYLIGEAAAVLEGCAGYFLASPNIANETHPPTAFLLPIAEGVALASPAVPDEVLAGFARKMVANEASAIVQRYQQSYRQTDGNFRVAVGQAIMTQEWTDGLAHLSAGGVPVGIVFGTKEVMIRTDYLDDLACRWEGRTHFVEGAAHLVNMEQAEAFNELLLRWAEDCFK